MRKFCLILLLTGLFGSLHGPLVSAQDHESADSQAVAERATRLKSLLDHLLVESNHSSIKKALAEGGESSDPLIKDALRLKADGERHLDEADYLQAAMTLQAALDKVLQAIRSGEQHGADGDALQRRLADAQASNDTFIAAAARVINGEPGGEAVELLAAARSARASADTSAAGGDIEAALGQLEESTTLAQKAITTVRNGKVIERGQ